MINCNATALLRGADRIFPKHESMADSLVKEAHKT